ncbi:MAG: DUF58 domain-containing protein [Planctomycetes bacterium]|nr:DUF58 domain-containing protein [Planctomycetota bacterium]
MADSEDIFGADFLRRLQALEAALLRLRGSAGEGVARRGRSQGNADFRGNRPYAQGDDIRRLDWNAYGRLGRLYLREFERERTEHVTLLVDQSLSMAAGEPPKHAAARRLAAAIGYLALAGGGSAALAGQPAIEGQARFPRLLDALRAASPLSGASLGSALAALAALRRAPSDLFVISDGLEPAEAFAPLAELTGRRTQVTLALLLAPQEFSPPLAGPVLVTGAEENETLPLNLDADLVAAYRQELDRHLADLALLARRNGWTLAVADSAADVSSLLLGELALGAP